MSGVIRTSVSPRRCCRTISCPAACGIRCVKPSSATTSPSWTSSSIASPIGTISATRWGRSRPLEGEWVRAALDGDPAEVGELVDDGAAAEAPEAGVLDAAERHLRLVADRLVVDVDDAGLDPVRERQAALGVLRDDPGREAIRSGVRTLHGLVGALDRKSVV